MLSIFSIPAQSAKISLLHWHQVSPSVQSCFFFLPHTCWYLMHWLINILDAYFHLRLFFLQKQIDCEIVPEVGREIIHHDRILELDHYLLAGNKDITRWLNMDSACSWCMLAVYLLKFSPVSKYDVMPLERHALTIVLYRWFEKYCRDSNYKDNGNGWLMKREKKKTDWGCLIITWSLYVIANDKFGSLLRDIHLHQLESKQSSGLGSQKKLSFREV